MFPKFQKPRIPTMGNPVANADYEPVARQVVMPENRHVGYPGGKAAYPGKFEKPKMVKPHKRF